MVSRSNNSKVHGLSRDKDRNDINGRGGREWDGFSSRCLESLELVTMILVLVGMFL